MKQVVRADNQSTIGTLWILDLQISPFACAEEIFHRLRVTSKMQSYKICCRQKKFI
jgi:hypothetical protein